MASKPPSSTTTTTTAALPDWQKPYQQSIWDAGQQIINNQRPEDVQSPYGDVQPWNQAQNTAQAMSMGRALEGNPLTQDAQAYAMNSLQGGAANPYATMQNAYMGPNPMLDQVAKNIGSSMATGYDTGTRATRDAQFARAGSYGSSAWNNQRMQDESAFADNLGKTMSNLYYGDYNRSGDLYESGLNRATGAYESMMGRNNQLAGMAPMLAQSDYYDIDRLWNSGARQQQQGQMELDALNTNWANTRDFGLNQLDQAGALLRMINGTGGGTTVSSSLGGSRNNYAGLLGGLGASFAGMFG